MNKKYLAGCLALSLCTAGVGAVSITKQSIIKSENTTTKYRTASSNNAISANEKLTTGNLTITDPEINKYIETLIRNKNDLASRGGYSKTAAPSVKTSSAKADNKSQINTAANKTSNKTAKATVNKVYTKPSTVKSTNTYVSSKSTISKTSSSKSISTKTSISSSIPAQTASPKASAVISTAKSFIGVPYVWGGTSPNGFDCSGFTQYVLNKNGITIPRTATEQYSTGTGVSKTDLQVGDLVFFTTYKEGPSHLGFYIGGGNFIHASSSKGVTISSLNSTYYSSRYVGARRLIS